MICNVWVKATKRQSLRQARQALITQPSELLDQPLETENSVSSACVSKRLYVEEQKGSHTAGFEAWMRSRQGQLKSWTST